MSIQKQAAELAEAADCAANDAREAHKESVEIYEGMCTQELVDYLAGQAEKCQKIAALLRQIASMDGDRPAPVAQVLTVQQHQRVILREPVIWIGQIPYGETLYTGNQLDSARLAGFEAGRRKGLEDAENAAMKNALANFSGAIRAIAAS